MVTGSQLRAVCHATQGAVWDARRAAVVLDASAVREGDIVAVFPEGTTGDGRELLPFHGNLVQAALSADVPVQPVGLRFIVAAAVFFAGVLVALRFTGSSVAGLAFVAATYTLSVVRVVGAHTCATEMCRLCRMSASISRRGVGVGYFRLYPVGGRRRPL